MSIPIYGEANPPASSSEIAPTDTIVLSAMEKAIRYLTALETTKNKEVALESLHTLILTVTNELSKLK
jgi:hypothetical protein